MSIDVVRSVRSVCSCVHLEYDAPRKSVAVLASACIDVHHRATLGALACQQPGPRQQARHRERASTVLKTLQCLLPAHETQTNLRRTSILTEATAVGSAFFQLPLGVSRPLEGKKLSSSGPSALPSRVLTRSPADESWRPRRRRCSSGHRTACAHSPTPTALIRLCPTTRAR